MAIILNIRGTNGAGKTTVVRGLMTALGRMEAIYPQDGARPEGYRAGGTSQKPKLLVVGRYDNTCGGCDTIKTTAEARTQVARYAQRATTVFEGVLISTVYQSWADFFSEQQERGHRVVIGYLDTPVSVCIARVRGRRAEKGNTVEFNPELLTDKYHAIWRTFDKFKAAGFDARRIRYDHAVDDAREMLGV